MRLFSPPNQLTLLRIILTPIFLWFFLSSDVNLQKWSIAIFTIAAITDWYDGWVARRWGYVTVWGAFLDPLADKVITSAALIAFAYLGLIKSWMVWIIVIRDIIITLLRSYGEYKGKSISTPMLSKTKTFLQFVLIYYLLILYVVKNTPELYGDYSGIIEFLYNGTLIYWMTFVVTFLTLWTGLDHIYRNRKTIYEIVDVSKFVKRRRNLECSDEEPSLLVKMFASGFFIGYVPVASGTIASVLAILLYYVPGFEKLIVLGPVLLLSIPVGIKASAVMEKRYGHDPAEVTIDEITGMWISLLLLPKKLMVIIIAFCLFRLIDVLKPYPIRKIDSLSGGLGIMLDDIVAGLYTNIMIRLLLIAPYVKDILQ